MVTFSSYCLGSQPVPLLAVFAKQPFQTLLTSASQQLILPSHPWLTWQSVLLPLNHTSSQYPSTCGPVLPGLLSSALMICALLGLAIYSLLLQTFLHFNMLGNYPPSNKIPLLQLWTPAHHWSMAPTLSLNSVFRWSGVLALCAHAVQLGVLKVVMVQQVKGTCHQAIHNCVYMWLKPDAL